MMIIVKVSLIALLAIVNVRVAVAQKQYNVLWLLLDDISAEKWPEYGNAALEGQLPGFTQLKEDGAVYYPNFFAPSSICAPAQVALVSSKEPADVGGQYQFSADIITGKSDYKLVPPDEVVFAPERLRSMGYYSAAGGKLDYQVAEVTPTFFNVILGGAYSDITSFQQRVWEGQQNETSPQFGMPFYGMLNMMDFHQFLSTFRFEAPVVITDSEGNAPDLPNGEYGYATNESIFFNIEGEITIGDVSELTDVDDADVSDIVGYNGEFDEDSISHENLGVPGYLPDEIGIRSILSREYDLMKNVDWRIQFMIEDLKERGLYDDTLFIIFGDHGSGTYKAKTLLQYQSMHAPMWIKYPADMELHPAVEIGPDGYNWDNRMAGVLDIYPTTLSVLGVEPDDWMTGIALAGEFAPEETRDTMYGVIQRYIANAGYKTFAAFTTEYFYQRFAFSAATVDEYLATLTEEEAAEWSMTIGLNSQAEGRYGTGASPIFDRVRWNLRVNADDDDYLQRYASLTADDVRPPEEALFDLVNDPYTITNLLREYIYTVEYSDDIQPWGTNVTGITLEYGPQDDSTLTAPHLAALTDLRAKLTAWIEGQAWVDEVAYLEDPYEEENAMAAVFWPGGVQPTTEEANAVCAIDTAKDVTTVAMSSPTGGVQIRYAITNEEGRVACDQLGLDVKASIPSMNITNAGVPLLTGVPPLWTRFLPDTGSYDGYLYGFEPIATDFQITELTFEGGNPSCNVFISADATLIQAGCPAGNQFVFDTRDSTWDGTEWVGVDDDSGEWEITPIIFWDVDAGDWNMDAFNSYVFGPFRIQMYTGFNSDGSVFVPRQAYQRPLSFPYEPATMYWFNPDLDVTAGTYGTAGWDLNSNTTSFDTDDAQNKGSWSLGIYRRNLPGLYNPVTFTFNSFNYECLFWGVGTEATLNYTAQDDDDLILFTQGVRKGYLDSGYVREDYSKGEQPAVASFMLWDADANAPLGEIKNKDTINLCELQTNSLTIQAVAPCAFKVKFKLVSKGPTKEVLAKTIDKSSPFTLDNTDDLTSIPALAQEGSYTLRTVATPGIKQQFRFNVVPGDC